MNDVEKTLLVAKSLRERARDPGPLSLRARMVILAERLEDIAGEHNNARRDLTELALSAYGRRLSVGSGASP